MMTTRTCARGHTVDATSGYQRPNGKFDCRACRALLESGRTTAIPVHAGRRAKARGLPQVIRATPFAVGDVVRLGNGDTPPDLTGQVRTVKSLAYMVTARERGWWLHFEDGRRARPRQVVELVRAVEGGREG